MKSTLIICLLLACATLASFSGTALAQPAGASDPFTSAASPIPEDDRPSAVWPWAIGGVLAAGALLVSLKDAKRSHQD